MGSAVRSEHQRWSGFLWSKGANGGEADKGRNSRTHWCRSAQDQKTGLEQRVKKLKMPLRPPDGNAEQVVGLSRSPAILMLFHCTGLRGTEGWPTFSEGKESFPCSLLPGEAATEREEMLSLN